jgi:alkanesulfonate monooxygenase SsuD/methylene tetrahydromethanopterin reductase-like flavin-dependent oxidoreductase (luciferase family)
VDLGVHLPLLAWDEPRYDVASLIAYVRTAERLGVSAVSVNDHLRFRRPWLDGPTALASVLSATGAMTVATTVVLPVVRGPIPLATSLAAIDNLSGGRLVVGVGPGSYHPDYEAAGIGWDERWPRFEEAIGALRALWDPDGDPFEGAFYSTSGIRLEPTPARAGGPPIWVGSWGSEAGLRRVARLGDGWLASAYNTTPQRFAEAWSRIRDLLSAHGKDPATFPNGLATMMFRIEADPATARRALEEWVAPALGRDPAELGERLLLGPAEACAERLARYAEAGVQRVFLWPVGDPVEQLERFGELVSPLLPGRAGPAGHRPAASTRRT